VREIVSETEIRNLIRRLMLEADEDSAAPVSATTLPAGAYERDFKQDPGPMADEILNDQGDLSPAYFERIKNIPTPYVTDNVELLAAVAQYAGPIERSELEKLKREPGNIRLKVACRAAMIQAARISSTALVPNEKGDDIALIAFPSISSADEIHATLEYVWKTFYRSDKDKFYDFVFNKKFIDERALQADTYKTAARTIVGSLSATDKTNLAANVAFEEQKTKSLAAENNPKVATDMIIDKMLRALASNSREPQIQEFRNALQTYDTDTLIVTRIVGAHYANTVFQQTIGTGVNLPNVDRVAKVKDFLKVLRAREELFQQDMSQKSSAAWETIKQKTEDALPAGVIATPEKEASAPEPAPAENLPESFAIKHGKIFLTSGQLRRLTARLLEATPPRVDAPDVPSIRLPDEDPPTLPGSRSRTAGDEETTRVRAPGEAPEEPTEGGVSIVERPRPDGDIARHVEDLKVWTPTVLLPKNSAEKMEYVPLATASPEYVQRLTAPLAETERLGKAPDDLSGSSVIDLARNTGRQQAADLIGENLGKLQDDAVVPSGDLDPAFASTNPQLYAKFTDVANLLDDVANAIILKKTFSEVIKLIRSAKDVADDVKISIAIDACNLYGLGKAFTTLPADITTQVFGSLDGIEKLAARIDNMPKGVTSRLAENSYLFKLDYPLAKDVPVLASRSDLDVPYKAALESSSLANTYRGANDVAEALPRSGQLPLYKRLYVTTEVVIKHIDDEMPRDVETEIIAYLSTGAGIDSPGRLSSENRRFVAWLKANWGDVSSRPMILKKRQTENLKLVFSKLISKSFDDLYSDRNIVMQDNLGDRRPDRRNGVDIEKFRRETNVRDNGTRQDIIDERRWAVAIDYARAVWQRDVINDLGQMANNFEIEGVTYKTINPELSLETRYADTAAIDGGLDAFSTDMAANRVKARSFVRVALDTLFKLSFFSKEGRAKFQADWSDGLSRRTTEVGAAITAVINAALSSATSSAGRAIAALAIWPAMGILQGTVDTAGRTIASVTTAGVVFIASEFCAAAVRNVATRFSETPPSVTPTEAASAKSGFEKFTTSVSNKTAVAWLAATFLYVLVDASSEFEVSAETSAAIPLAADVMTLLTKPESALSIKDQPILLKRMSMGLAEMANYYKEQMDTYNESKMRKFSEAFGALADTPQTSPDAKTAFLKTIADIKGTPTP
jgi:hypothetical protein